MWKKTREDGSRRMKNNAVPTLFCFSKEVIKRKPPKNRQLTIPLDHKIEVSSISVPESLECNLNNVHYLSNSINQNTKSNDDQH